MNIEHELTITVNYPDDTEREFQAAAMGHSIGAVVDMALSLNNVDKEKYSSLVIVVTGNTAKPKKPELRVVS